MTSTMPGWRDKGDTKKRATRAETEGATVITMTLTDNNRTLETRCAYGEKDRLKALAPYPDVRWQPERRCWLLVAMLIDQMIRFMPELIAPHSPEFWMALPVPGESNRPNPKRRRRQTYQERQEERERAGEVGRAVVGMKGALP